MTKAKGIHYAGADFMLSPDEVDVETREYIEACYSPGMDAEPGIRVAMSAVPITGDSSDCAAYLRGYGAWDDEELSNHEDNLMRLLWLTAGAWADGESAYFSTY